MMLGEFLKAAAEQHGPWNCSTLAADWCIALGYPDFAARWRDTTDPVDCEMAPAEAGGLAVLWGRDIADGLPVADVPYLPGDIAVLSMLGIEAGAIYTGDKWALRTARGMSFHRLPDSAVAAAWRP